jgi:hypothetical protein
VVFPTNSGRYLNLIFVNHRLSTDPVIAYPILSDLFLIGVKKRRGAFN